MHVDERVKQYLDKAGQLRFASERQASQSNHEAAIKSLEQSTQNLIRALRNAGFFIPG